MLLTILKFSPFVKFSKYFNQAVEMRFLPIIFGYILTIFLISIINILLSKITPFYNKKWKKKYRNIIFLLPTVIFLFILLSSFMKIAILEKISALSMLITLLTIFSFTLSLPILFLFLKLFFRKKREIKDGEKVANSGRREFLKKGLLAVPTLTVLTAGKGVYEGYSMPKIPKIPLSYNNLHKDLVGMKIMQISDLHIGLFVDTDRYQKMINIAKKENPDIVFITGDFVDHYHYLDKTIEITKQLTPKYGIYYCLGNHEYFRGYKPVLEALKRYNIPYFIDSGKNIDVGDAKLFISGLDDPRRMRGNLEKFMENGLSKTVKNRDNNVDFSILMSHRPSAFPTAAKYKIDLTLAGHTHGGQFGFNGRNPFDNDKRYLWGLYNIDRYKLYTTSGAGHWFPVRFNCPAEIPVFILQQS